MTQGVRNAKTSHFGRHNPYVRRGFCDFCGETRNLYSYDTRDFFALGRIPLVPARALRVLDACERCTRHGTLSQRDWGRERKLHLDDVKLAMETDPGNSELAAQLAQGYARCQDEAGFDAMLPRLRRIVKNSAEGLQALGSVFGVFGRRAEEIEVMREALVLEDTPKRREALALSLALGLEPREACEHLRHLLGPAPAAEEPEAAGEEGADAEVVPKEGVGPEEAEDEGAEAGVVTEERGDLELAEAETPDEEASRAPAGDEDEADEADEDEEEDDDEPLFSEEEANLIFLVARSAQSAGDHALALELLGTLEAAIPNLDLSEVRSVSTGASEGKKVRNPTFDPRPQDPGPSRPTPSRSTAARGSSSAPTVGRS